MKILVISYEFPFPANHGARYDIWNRVLSLKKLGAKVFLISWFELQKGNLPSDEDIIHVREVVDELVMIKISRDLKRVFSLLRYPWHVASRLVNNYEYDKIKDRLILFEPKSILVETVYPSMIALQLAKDLGIPFFVRQHNIEHVYMHGQMKRANSLKEKFLLILSTIHLKAYEHKVLKLASGHFDISIEDLSFWKTKGIINSYWLPPIYINHKSNFDCNSEKLYDIAFFGNLYSPNNVDGICWFINKVLPKLLLLVPDINILLAGSSPTQYLFDITDIYSNVTILSNPKSIDTLCSKSKVLINPVQFGSGVNIKSIDMLFKENHVVSTSIGVYGLPDLFHNVFSVTDDPSQFADFIHQAILNLNEVNYETRNCLRNMFLPKILEKIIPLLALDESETNEN